MSDTLPDRKEEAGAPDGQRNPWVGYLGVAVLSLALYVLSVGPVQWLVFNDYVPAEVAYIHLPLDFLPHGLKVMLVDYVSCWRP